MGLQMLASKYTVDTIYVLYTFILVSHWENNRVYRSILSEKKSFDFGLFDTLLVKSVKNMESGFYMCTKDTKSELDHKQDR